MLGMTPEGSQTLAHTTHHASTTPEGSKTLATQVPSKIDPEGVAGKEP